MRPLRRTAKLLAKAEAADPSATFETAVEIGAPVGQVWAILSDFSAYPDWNPFITAVSGRLRRGARLELHLAPPELPAVVVHARLLVIRRPSVLRWSGEVVAPGLFDGIHSFHLDPLGESRCCLRQSERLFGVLAPMLAPSLLESTRAGYEAMNRALKARAEQR